LACARVLGFATWLFNDALTTRDISKETVLPRVLRALRGVEVLVTDMKHWRADKGSAKSKF
jgi:hypothetical protein